MLFSPRLVQKKKRPVTDQLFFSIAVRLPFTAAVQKQNVWQGYVTCNADKLKVVKCWHYISFKFVGVLILQGNSIYPLKIQRATTNIKSTAEVHFSAFVVAIKLSILQTNTTAQSQPKMQKIAFFVTYEGIWLQLTQPSANSRIWLSRLWSLSNVSTIQKTVWLWEREKFTIAFRPKVSAVEKCCPKR